MDPPSQVSDDQLEDIVLRGKAAFVSRTFAAKDPFTSKFLNAMTSFKAQGIVPEKTVKVLLQDCDAALQELDKIPSHPYTLILAARKHLICLSSPSSPAHDVAAACDFFNRQHQVTDHISHLQKLAEDEGGTIETVSQVDKDAPDLPAVLSNQLFSLDSVLSSQLSGVNLGSARQQVHQHFLAALLPVSISQGNVEESVKLLNALNTTNLWPSHIPSASHIRQHRGAPKSASIFAPFTKGSGGAIIAFSQFSTVISSTPIAPGAHVYFEVHVLSSGESPQFGLASEKFSACSDYTGDGVGDDAHSWGIDGVRKQLWHNGSSPVNVAWTEGDVIGFAVDTGVFKCDVSVNGKAVVSIDISGAKGGMFGKAHSLFPAFTGSNCCIKVNLGEDPFCHPTLSGRLMTAAPAAVLAPSLVETIVKYLNFPRKQSNSSVVDPVSAWNSSDISSLRQNLSLDAMWQIATLCPEVASSATFLTGLFDRQNFAPKGPKVVKGSLQYVLEVCATAEAVIKRLPHPNAGYALALSARIIFHRLDSMQQLGICDAALLEQFLKMKRSHFLEYCDKDTLSNKGASWDSSRFFSLKFHFPDDFLQTSSFAAAHDYILPLKPIDVMAERRTIQSCLAILFSAASVTRYQPWDTYVFPPEIVELVFLDVKACGGDVKAAASLNEKTDLARRFSHFVNLRFLQTENAVLTVLPSTPRMFDAEDVSFVDLEIKGISSLTINVFAIEFAEFCKTGVFEVTTSFSVEGLLPLWTESILFDHMPHVFHRETVRFPQMKGRGVWLVDMIGSELISRAIIHKGDCFIASRLTQFGTRLSLHDVQHSSNPIIGAKFWFEGREFLAQSDGYAVIPFMDHDKECTVSAAAPEGFACAKNIFFRSESWEATVAVIAPHETFVPGCSANIVLRCGLFLSSQRLRIPLSELESPSISLEALDQTGTILQTSSSKVSFNDSCDLTLPWAMPTGCTVLNASLKASVSPRSTVNGKISINACASVQMPPSPTAFHPENVAVIQAAFTRSDIIVPHLRLGSNTFWLDVLYSSGHPVRGHSFEVVVRTFASKNSFSFNLKSNEDGRIDLGSLSGVVSIAALGYVFPVTTHFISAVCDRVVVPHIEGSTVFIPANLITAELLPQLTCSMHHVVQCSESGQVIANLSSAIQSSERKGIVVNVPSPGQYTLKMFCCEGVRSVSMLVAAPASACDFLSVNIGSTCELLEPVVPVDCRISSVQCRDSNLVVAVAGSSTMFEKMKICVWFCSSFPLSEKFSDVSALAPHHIQRSSIFANKGSQMLNKVESGLKLGHEPLYILNRKKQKVSWLGVSLPRPSLVSVPRELGAVETAIRRAQHGQSFVGRSDFASASASSSSAMHGMMPLSRKAPTPAKPAAKCISAQPKSEGGQFRHDVKEEEEYISDDEEVEFCDSRATRRSSQKSSDTSGCPRVEHLAMAAVFCTNLQIDASGVSSFKLPEEFVGASLVMLSSDSSCEWEIVHCFSSVHGTPPSLLQRQLCLTQPFTPDSHMALQPSAKVLMSGEEMPILNDVGGVYTSIEDLCPLLNASSLFPLAVDLARWSSFSTEEKMSFYIKEASHELHLFLHAHDPLFFAAHVAPAISNRLNLDFIDVYLTGGDISEFATLERCSSLNVCEKILLARSIGGRVGSAIALDVVRRCSALDVPVQDWKDSVTLNAAMSFGVFSRGVAEQADESALGERSTADAPVFQNELKEMSKKMAKGGGSGEGGGGGGGRGGPSTACPPPPAAPQAAPIMYQAAGKVKQIAEQRWMQVPQPSCFFKVLALHTASCISTGTGTPFVSPFISTAGRCALVALSFISLPLTSATPAARLQRRTNHGISSNFLVSSAICLRYFKDTVAIAPPPDTRTVIVGQHILESVFDPASGWKKVTIGEQGCLVGIAYALRTIVTNVSDKNISVNVLTQVPCSSMPLYGTLHTNAKKLKVPSFSVKVVDDWFFFPLPGQTTVYPAQVASLSGDCIGCAVPMPTVRVTTSVSVSADSSWSLIVTHGSEEQLLSALTSDMGLLRMRVVHILGRLAQSSALLHSVLGILRDNHICIPVVWALGLAGKIRDVAAEFLIHIAPPRIISALVGSSIPLPIVSHGTPYTVIRPSVLDDSGLMTGVCDFEPVFNSRAHTLGSYSTIAIDAMRKQYRRVMWKVAIDPDPVRSDCIQIGYLLALQDRFSEAWAYLNSLKQPGFTDIASKHVSELYLLAYLAMTHPDDSQLALVPSIMDTLRSRAVRPEWSRRVEVLQEQLLESFEGKARPPSSSDLVRMRPHTAKAVHVDSFAFSVKVRNEEKTVIDLVASGFTSSSSVYIKIYQLDIEVIFSKDPFLVAGRGKTIAAGSMFAAVAPHAVIEEIMEAVPEGTAVTAWSKSVELPSLESSPCFFLSVECNGVKASQTVFKSRMTIACAEQLGIITVNDALSSVPARNAYVKVYIKLKNGNIEFYKDGYTDRRGKFDYVSLNTGQMQQADDIAILVCSADGDCNVTRASPPAGI